jgi:DNA-binding transcriptional regulator YdaS (Cro superfamily)
MSARIKMKRSLAQAGLVLGLCLQLQAMDRWSALSQMESGDNDRAVGGAGEVSRYQIKPEIWWRYAPNDADWTDPNDALAVATQIMRERCAAFERAAHRPPTDSEFYILWNAPAQVRRPGKAVLGRAERFCNLLQRR